VSSADLPRFRSQCGGSTSFQPCRNQHRVGTVQYVLLRCIDLRGAAFHCSDLLLALRRSITSCMFFI